MTPLLVPVIISLLFSLVLLPCIVRGKDVKRDPKTGIIRVLYIGTPFRTLSPYNSFRTDPLLSPTPVSGLAWLQPDIIQKALRLYLPRNRAQYAEYDVIGLDDTSFEHFPPNTLIWMKDSLLEDGMGFFMGGGSGSFGGAHGFPSYADTPLQDVMPVDCVNDFREFCVNAVTKPGDDFIRSVPWDGYENHNFFGGYNILRVRDGAVQLSELRPMAGGEIEPGWTWWDIGRGRFFASPTTLRGSVGTGGVTTAGRVFLLWKHYGDFVSNMAYFLTGLTPPTDTQLLYTTRLRFREIDYHRSMVTGTMEFISRFGAPTGRVDEKLGEVEELLSIAKQHFVDLDLAQSLGQADRVIQLLEEADEIAMKAKQSALLWVYVIEWLAVTSTLLLSSLTLWTLMMRKKLYREVSSTHIKPT